MLVVLPWASGCSISMHAQGAATPPCRRCGTLQASARRQVVPSLVAETNDVMPLWPWGFDDTRVSSGGKPPPWLRLLFDKIAASTEGIVCSSFWVFSIRWLATWFYSFMYPFAIFMSLFCCSCVCSVAIRSVKGITDLTRGLGLVIKKCRLHLFGCSTTKVGMPKLIDSEVTLLTLCPTYLQARRSGYHHDLSC